MITDYGEERQRSLVFDYFGNDARIRVLRRAEIFGAAIFVVDFDRGPRNFRTLGSFGGGAQVTEQSSMDLLYPSRLVFHYERLMSLAFAMSARSINALLLGVGGAAMWRFMRAYLPDCAPTLVDSDETIIATARRWFYLKQPVVLDTAQRFLAGSSARYDVILVDLYGPGGPAESDESFLDALPRRAGARRLSRQQLGRLRRQPEGPADVRLPLRRRASPRFRADIRDPPRLPRQSGPVRGDPTRALAPKP